MAFVLSAIAEHQQTDDYRIAEDAELYYKHQNPTIMRYQKLITNQLGQKVVDIWSPNNKIASNWYSYFITQAVQYLLGNGVTFKNEATKNKLGKRFDKNIQDLATYAKNGGVSFGFWNYDHIEVFKYTEFVPLYDEEDASLKGGIRFWQIDYDKPLRVTLYELDGITEYIRRKGKEIEIYQPKRAYKVQVASSKVDGERVVAYANYPTFPIVPFYNIEQQSEIVGNRGTIDAYDLMISGLINNVSEGDLIYWVLKNCNAMSPEDDARFIEQLKLTHVTHADGDDGAGVEAHQVEVPFQASAEALDRLERQLYKDFMALKVDDISAGATNDQIQAAYEPINQRTDRFEYCVTDFIQGVLELAGIEDSPTYTRSQMSNRAETIDTIVAAAEYLPRDYIIEKLVTLLGDADRAKDLIGERLEEDEERYVENSVENVENPETEAEVE